MVYLVNTAKLSERLGDEAIGELVAYSEHELLRTKNFGVTSLQEIKTKLSEMGISLKRD